MEMPITKNGRNDFYHDAGGYTGTTGISFLCDSDSTRPLIDSQQCPVFADNVK